MLPGVNSPATPRRTRGGFGDLVARTLAGYLRGVGRGQVGASRVDANADAEVQGDRPKMNRYRSIRWALGIVALAALGSSTAHGQDAPALKVETDIAYTKAGGDELKLDIVRPAEGDGPFPAVFVIHGGAWRAGNKRDVRKAMDELARRGYVTVSPQYRFCPKQTFPAQVHDVKAAVRWLKEHAKDYKVDTEHVGAVGFSAGAHLAMMLGLTQAADGLEGPTSQGGGDGNGNGNGDAGPVPNTRIQAVVNYFGPTDLAASDIPEVSKPLLRDFLGGTPAEKPKETAQASPITFVSKDDPPVLTFQGTKDPLVPHTQATKLADALTDAGVPGRVELLVGAGHGWGGDLLQHTVNEMIAFFDQYLKPSKK
jgi:acetyl esterase/lipase